MRLRLFRLLDVVLVTEPDQIRWLNDHPDVVRPLASSAGWLQRVVNRRVLEDLHFDAGTLPVFQRRDDAERSQRQAELAASLTAANGQPSSETQQLGAYVAGRGSPSDVGVTTQHWCGRLFSPRYHASASTYEAGQRLAGWPSVPPWRAWLDRARGTLANAKRVVADAAGGDLHAIHGTSIGMENITKTIFAMRALADEAGAATYASDDAVRRTLKVPPALVRGCEREVHAPFLDRPLTRQTVIVFLLSRAYGQTGDLELAFLAGSWSACPARHVVPEMLKSVWEAAQAPKISLPSKNQSHGQSPLGLDR